MAERERLISLWFSVILGVLCVALFGIPLRERGGKAQRTLGSLYY